jgi:hypothetical protein
MNYFDHEPEILTQSLSLKYLIGTPIGFIGGNSLLLLVCLGFIAFGAVSRRSSRQVTMVLLVWFVVPPVLLYGYSLVKHPIFGPSRYTLFVAPVYLLLLAQGLRASPRRLAIVAVATFAVSSSSLLWSTVYRRGLRADWRSAIMAIRRDSANRGVLRPRVIVLSDSATDSDLETARYYGRPPVRITSRARDLTFASRPSAASEPIWVVMVLRNDMPVTAWPAAPAWIVRREIGRVEGLLIEEWSGAP